MVFLYVHSLDIWDDGYSCKQHNEWLEVEEPPILCKTVQTSAKYWECA